MQKEERENEYLLSTHCLQWSGMGQTEHAGDSGQQRHLVTSVSLLRQISRELGGT